MTFPVTLSVHSVFQSEWPEGQRLAAAMNFRWPQMVPTPLKQVIPSAGPDGLQLMRDMMLWDPEKRPSAQQVGLMVLVVHQSSTWIHLGLRGSTSGPC